jgi:hypothetical protein
MTSNNIQKRLYDIEAIPPAGIWNRIAAKLEEDADTSIAPVVALPVRKNNWMRIALAASVLGFVITTALWLTKKEAKEKEIPGSTAVAKPEPIIIKDTVYITKPETATPNTNTAPLVNNTINANPVTTPITIAPTPTNNSNSGIVKKTVQNTKQPTNDTPKDLTVPNNQTQVLVDNTRPKDIIIKDQNGKPVRNIEVVKTTETNGIAGPDSKGDKTIGTILSKISMASDGEEIDSIINNSSYWKKQIKDWRDKLIKSGYTPNLINGLDFEGLKKLLEQQK